jgi:hypothetical protein
MLAGCVEYFMKDIGKVKRKRMEKLVERRLQISTTQSMCRIDLWLVVWIIHIKGT